MILSDDGSLRDRFQGAVMGLWMVPMALASKHSGKDSNSELSVDSCGPTALTDETARYLTQIDIFLHSPQHFRLLGSDSILMLSSLPLLLRYSSDYKRRCSVVFDLLAEGMLEQNTQRLMQILILGDVLSMALNASALSASFPSSATLEVRASDCGLSSFQRRNYADLWRSLSDRVLRNSAAVSDEVIESIAIAITHANNYSAAVRMAHRMAQRTWSANDAPTASAPLAVSGMVAGIVAGAIGGRTSLPVLWQMHAYSEPHYPQKGNLVENYTRYDWRLYQVVSLANRLFDQWAGVARKSHTIIAR